MKYFISLLALLLITAHALMAQKSVDVHSTRSTQTFTVVDTSPYMFEAVDSTVYCGQEVTLRGFVDTNIYEVILIAKCNTFLPGQTVGINVFYKPTPTLDTSRVELVRIWQNYSLHVWGYGFTIADFDNFMDVGDFRPDKCDKSADLFKTLTGASIHIRSIPIILRTNENNYNGPNKLGSWSTPRLVSKT